jgi:hypothetical protein
MALDEADHHVGAPPPPTVTLGYSLISTASPYVGSPSAGATVPVA